jgi:hypothetical protein
MDIVAKRLTQEPRAESSGDAQLFEQEQVDVAFGNALDELHIFHVGTSAG